MRNAPKKNADADSQRFMPLDEACEYAAFGRTTAYQLIRKGKIVARKLGARTVIDRRSLDKFLDTLPKVAP